MVVDVFSGNKWRALKRPVRVGNAQASLLSSARHLLSLCITLLPTHSIHVYTSVALLRYPGTLKVKILFILFHYLSNCTNYVLLQHFWGMFALLLRNSCPVLWNTFVSLVWQIVLPLCTLCIAPFYNNKCCVLFTAHGCTKQCISAHFKDAL